ncbi:MAG: type 4a pilus biogenesis protein PilO [Methylococcales bacterium]|jgi:Tfp pilus assembly protein PilN|nr:type 4a pilus biogenesis protein PilO [Methylococcales bacterium]
MFKIFIISLFLILSPVSFAENSSYPVEIEFWQSVKNKQDISYFQAYIKKYPDGFFKELALIEIKKFQQREKRQEINVIKHQTLMKKQLAERIKHKKSKAKLKVIQAQKELLSQISQLTHATNLQTINSYLISVIANRPGKLFFSKIQTDSKIIELHGIAESKNEISTFMRYLDRSKWLSKPELTSIKQLATNKHQFLVKATIGPFQPPKNSNFLWSKSQASDISNYYQKLHGKLINQQKTELSSSKLMPLRDKMQDHYNSISQTGLASGIEFDLFDPQSQAHFGFYSAQYLRVKVTGNFKNITSFIINVSRLPKLIGFSEIMLQKDIKKAEMLRMDAVITLFSSNTATTKMSTDHINRLPEKTQGLIRIIPILKPPRIGKNVLRNPFL